MAATIVDLTLAKLREQGIEPFTWSFIFNEVHAAKRNEVFIGGGQRRTLLSELLERISTEQRHTIFPGTFDLGNHLDSGRIFTKSDLVKEIAEEFVPKHSESDPLVPNKAFNYINPWIDKITGQSVEKHIAQNSLKTLKVLKLLYRVVKKRKRSLFMLIRPIEGTTRPSLEHRDRHPLRGNENQVWLLADLKSYLRMELDPERAARIELLFDDILPRLQEFINNLNGNLTIEHGSDPIHMDCAVNEVISSLLKQKKPERRTDESNRVPLDEHLYLHLCSLDFLNYVGEFKQIAELTTPDTHIRPIQLDIESLREKVKLAGASPYSGGPVAPLTESGLIYATWEQDLLPLIEKVTDTPLKRQEYIALAKPAEELLYRYFLFKWGDPDPTQYPLGIFEYLTAACAIWHEMQMKTTYKPYWLGQQAQGRRILSTLDKPLRYSTNLNVEEIPEALHQIWVGRYRWMADAIKGQQASHSIRSKLALSVLLHARNAVQSGSIDLIERELHVLG